MNDISIIELGARQVGKADSIVVEKSNREELISQAVFELLSDFPPVKQL